MLPVALEATTARLELQQSVDGARFVLGRLGKTLGGAPRGGGQTHGQPRAGEHAQHGAHDGRLAHAGTTGNHHHLAQRGGLHRALLRRRECDTGAALEPGDGRLQTGQLAPRAPQQPGQAVGDVLLGLEQPREIHAVVFHHHALRCPQRVDGGLHVRGVNFEHLRRALREVFPRRQQVTLIRQLSQRVQHAGLRALRVIAGDAQRARDAVRGLEADPVHLQRQTIGRALHHRRGAVPVTLVDARSQRGRRPVGLEQQHDAAHGALLGPGAPDLFHPASTDTGHVAESLRVLVQHRKRLHAKALHDALGQPGTDTFDQSRPQIALEPHQSAGLDGHERVDPELLSAARIVDEVAGDPHAGPRPHGLKSPHHGHRLPPRRTTLEPPHADHPEARLLVLEGDALHFSGQGGRHAPNLPRNPRLLRAVGPR